MSNHGALDHLSHKSRVISNVQQELESIAGPDQMVLDADHIQKIVALAQRLGQQLAQGRRGTRELGHSFGSMLDQAHKHSYHKIELHPQQRTHPLVVHGNIHPDLVKAYANTFQ